MSQIIKTEQGFDVLDDDDEIIGKGFSNEFLSNYSEASDEQGLSVLCPLCDDQLHFNEAENIFVCLGCGYEMSRQDFLEYINADVPGEECLTCDSLYPGRTWCTYGYVKDEDEF